jgi:predicted metalloprotease
MKLDDQQESDQIEDRRGMGGGARTIGIGTIAIALVAWYFGIDPTTVLDLAQNLPAEPAQQQSAPAGAHDPDRVFVAKVLGSTEDAWQDMFARANGTYRKPHLVLFTGATPSACGTGQAAMGPFYCPGDEKVYIDLAFYRDLRERFRAPGDFAQAYVIAHEVGHHVQKLTGISEKVDAMRARMSAAEFNHVSVRMELQADCFAGVWAHHARDMKGIVEPGDVEEALTAAAAIGDDRIQRQTQGRVAPDSFTHGTSEQRVRWFRRGLDAGNLQSCDTFATRAL